jgi:hypothetical protein
VVARVPYDPRTLDATSVVHRLARAHPNVVFVSAYIDDGVALRRAIVRHHLHLLGNIGSSSSYCMPAFGARLGRDAVGVFASDKPAAEYMAPDGLRRSARALLHQADARYRALYNSDMSAAALAGFSGAWALLHYVLPLARSFTPAGISTAARSLDLPKGTLPNGSGLAFGHTPATASENLHASSVIWEWVGVDKRAVVWPPRFATHKLELMNASR